MGPARRLSARALACEPARCALQSVLATVDRRQQLAPARRPSVRWNRSMTAISAAPSRAAAARAPCTSEQRVAAQVEEVVVAGRRDRAEHARARSPATRRCGLRSSATSATDGSARRGPAAAPGSALRSTLPFGVSGSAVEHDEGGGTMYSGSFVRSSVAQPPRRRRCAAARAAPRRRPAAGRRARPRARPRPLRRTRRVRASTASISPSSMRIAAHLDLVVEAAEELERRRRRASAPGRRCGRCARRRRPPEWIGTNRSAVSSGRSR